MPMQVADLLGLNELSLANMPIARTPAQMLRLVQQANTQVSLMGSRHSQGGHTVVANGTAIITEPMNEVLLKRDAKTGHIQSVSVEAGTTWNVLHAHLAPLGYAPLVQQSSPHFTVGGSISVNCHGRDPRLGPLSSCIETLEVYLPSADEVKKLRPTDDLFKAVVGGYGSAAVILRATLKVTSNDLLEQKSQALSLKRYAAEIERRQACDDWPDLHYAWLNFSQADLYQDVLMVDCVRVQDCAPVKEPTLGQDAWLNIELMRWLWDQHRQKTLDRNALWQTVVAWFKSENGKQQSRTAWLRQAISFTAHRSERAADMLQEYFVPLDRLESFVNGLREILYQHEVNLLSSTVRVVQADTDDTGCYPLSYLCYAPAPRACIALDFEAPLSKRIPTRGRVPAPSNHEWVDRAIDLAYLHGGSYYLPYYGFASQEQFERLYPYHQKQRAACDSKLSNRFVQTYLAD